MQITREELNERLRRGAELRRTLRRASLKLMSFGKELLEKRAAERRDRSR
ncbi:MAG TPA: hypothetical protein VGM39_12445 [Kofleriaceae bacterium]